MWTCPKMRKLTLPGGRRLWVPWGKQGLGTSPKKEIDLARWWMTVGTMGVPGVVDVSEDEEADTASWSMHVGTMGVPGVWNVCEVEKWTLAR